MTPKAIILDADPGIDFPGSDVADALAIVLSLLHSGRALLDSAIVGGNAPIEEGDRVLKISVGREVIR